MAQDECHVILAWQSCVVRGASHRATRLPAGGPLGAARGG